MCSQSLRGSIGPGWAVTAQTLKSTLKVTKALADMQRIRILLLLEGGELCVCRIIAVLGLAPSTVSKHLSLLSAAGLVDARKDSRWVYYRLPQGSGAGPVRPVLDWLKETLRGDVTVEADKALLEEVLALDQCDVARNQRSR